MNRSKDPITAAARSHLWPYLEGIGFVQVTPRKYAREKADIIQQLWIDANGVGGKSRTIVILCCNFPFGSIDGYMDPHGFRICDEKRWNMSTHVRADAAMKEVVTALEESELDKLDGISTSADMLRALKGFWRKEWYEANIVLAKRWVEGDEAMREISRKNRAALNLC